MIVLTGESGAGKRTLRDLALTKYPDKFGANDIVILNWDEIEKMNDYGIEMIIIYLFVDAKSRIEKMINNGENPSDCILQEEKEKLEYKNIEDKIHFGIDNTGYHMSSEETLACLIGIIEERDNEYI